MMGELERVDSKKWIWIVVAVLLLSGGTGGIGGMGSGNFLTDLKCGNNSWIWILLLIFLFSDGF